HPSYALAYNPGPLAEGTTIDTGAAITLVGFDPIADRTKAALFKLLYQSDSLLVGPYTGTLGERIGTVRITQLVGADGNTQVLVDEVRYDSTNGWANDTIDSDRTIHRTSESAFGSFAASWNSDRADPGTVTFDELLGDLTLDGIVDIEDVDAVCFAIRASELTTVTDVNGDGAIDTDDLHFIVSNLLGTTAGDANLDGVFNSRDLVAIFQANTFEDDVEDNSSWGSGDWNCDGDFTTFDLVVAFRAAAYTASLVPHSFVANAIVEENPSISLRDVEHAAGRRDDEPHQARPHRLRIQDVDSLFVS
ncbi:hypothetical protein ACFL2H_02900, partial [Planctomycetota bacterium]